MREYIVFVSKDHYNPLGIVRSLGEAGIRPIVVAVKSKPKQAGISKYVKKAFYVDSSEDGIRLIISKFATSTTEKSFIMTGDDVSIMTMDKHYDELKDYFYFPNAGEAGRVAKYMDKAVLYEVATRHGFNVAKTWKVKPGFIPSDIEYPIITKALNSFGSEWKDIVYICHNDEELKTAFSKMKSPEVLLQRYIEDKITEAGYEGFSINHGEDLFISIQARDVYVLPGQYCPLIEMKNCDDKAFIEQMRGMLKEIGFEGMCEAEFVVDSKGTYWFLEINFRNTIMGWSTTVAGMPDPVLWTRATIDGKIPDNIYKKIRPGFLAMAECFDYDARVKAGMISHSEWMKEYKKVDAKLYKGRHDFWPFFNFMWFKLWHMKKH